MTDDNQTNEQLEVNDDADTAIDQHSPLSAAPWPRFPEGLDVRLPTPVAESLYRAAMGMTGLIRILHQSNRLRDNLAIYEGETEFPLSEFDEGNLWSGLIALSEGLNRIVEDMHGQAMTDAKGEPL